MVHVSVKNRDAAQPRLRRIARLYQSGLTQSEIGRVLGVSRERARQLVNKARDAGLIENGARET